MTTKVQRQGAVAQLIADHDVTSHTQLVTLLKKAGIVATQATVSRDLEEIGAVKVRTSHGETAYAIPEFERGFNQLVLYGKEASVSTILSHARKFPMMADRQVVIVKEAQNLTKTIEQLVDYVKNPQLSTVLVFNYKYKTLDKRKALYKSLSKSAIVFDSKKIYEDHLDALNEIAKGLDMLVER